jgi:hypothetical protein
MVDAMKKTDFNCSSVRTVRDKNSQMTRLENMHASFYSRYTKKNSIM